MNSLSADISSFLKKVDHFVMVLLNNCARLWNIVFQLKPL